MESVIIQDFRCFHSKLHVRLAPLTFLVGENSTGKSAFLAAVRLAWDVAAGIRQPDLNEEPFQLGAWDQVANYRAGPGGGRATSISIGLERFVQHGKSRRKAGHANLNEIARVLATLHQVGAQPIVKEWRIDSERYSILVTPPNRNGNESSPAKIELKGPFGSRTSQIKTPIFEDSVDFRYLSIFIRPNFFNDEDRGERPPDSDAEALSTILRHVSGAFVSRPYAMAPIRTEPKRTYHPAKESQKAAGAHVPMELAEMAGGDEKAWNRLREHLNVFGTASGLFKGVNVKRLGKKVSDPFQLEVKVSGRAANLVDVGYGVSQALPILFDSIVGDHTVYLMQQPEVHLHPRAQAELATHLGLLAKTRGKQFVVETHSDYIIDRARLDVRDGKHLSPDDVMILYFERDGQDVSVHPIRIDERGNIVNAPENYRAFFLDEERRFFGV